MSQTSPQPVAPPGRRTAWPVLASLVFLTVVATAAYSLPGATKPAKEPPGRQPEAAAEAERPPSALTIYGTTLDFEGEPIAGAPVSLHPRGADERRQRPEGPYPEPVARTRTDENGRFRLDAPRPGYWTVVAYDEPKPNHQGVTLARPLEPLLPPPSGAPALPLELGPVILFGPDRESLDAMRGWRPSRGWELASRQHPDRAGETPAPREAAEVEASTLEELERRVWVAGRVIDAAGEPVPGVRVESRFGNSGNWRMPPGSGDPGTWTGADGRFLIAGLEPLTRHQIFAMPEDGPAAYVELPKARIGAGSRPEPVPELELVLHPSFRMTGEVVDERGEPIAGARVGLLPEALFRSLLSGFDADRNVVLTSADGRFALENPLPMPSILVAVAQGKAVHHRRGIDVSPAAGSVDLGEVALAPEARVLGRMVDAAGNAVAGVEVGNFSHEMGVQILNWIGDAGGDHLGRAVTDERGAFSFGSLVPGEAVRLSAHREGAVAKAEGVAARDPEPLVMPMGGDAFLAGRVVDPEGRPVARAVVRSAPPSYDWRPSEDFVPYGSAETDESGRFEISIGSPGYTYVSAFSLGVGYAHSGVRKVTIGPGERIEGLEIALRRAHDLVGRVVDPSGAPIAGVDVYVFPQSLGSRTGEDGRFEIPGQPADTLLVTFRRTGEPPVRREIELVPGEPITVTLPGPGPAGR